MKGNPESGTFLLVESGILGFEIQNTAQGIRNPTNDWNQEYSLHCQRLESSVWNLESAAWNPESKTYFLDSQGGVTDPCVYSRTGNSNSQEKRKTVRVSGEFGLSG